MSSCEILNPQTEDDACTLVAGLTAAGSTAEIVGGGTRSGLGRPVQASKKISTSGLTGITNYDPAELVMSARAGTPLAEIEKALDKADQMLTFEPMDHRALLASHGNPTIGAIFACNISGPRRLSAGAARDSLLGVRFVNGHGELIKAGGRVMKNVTGLDLVKLQAGAWGTLGLLTEVTFKVLPAPQTSVTIVISGLEDETASKAMAKAMSLPTEVSGAAHLPEAVSGQFLDRELPDGAATVLRLEGLEASVSVRSDFLAKEMATFGEVTVLPNDLSKRLWQEIRDVKPFADGSSRPVWRVSLAPSQGWRFLAGLRMQSGVNAYFDLQGGLLWLRMEQDADADLVRHYVKAVGGGHAMLVRADQNDRQKVDVFQPQSAAVMKISQRLKQRFDPDAIFNRGRMSLNI